ncbi:MAG: hypothetical protein ACEPOW_14425 [Bacteroidales bacterium]
MHFEIKDFDLNLLIDGYQPYFDSFHSSLVINLYNLEKSKGKLVYFNNKLIASILPDYFGDNFAALDFFYLDSIGLFELKDMFSRLDEIKTYSKNIIIRNIPLRNINQINKSFKTFNFRNPLFSFQVYPSENEFPHVVYSFTKNEYLCVKTIKIGEVEIPLYEGKKFSEYRYTINRLIKKYPSVVIEKLNKQFYYETLESWKSNFFNNRESEIENKYSFLSENNFTRFWFNPIEQFWSFYNRHNNRIRFVSNAVSFGKNKGFWIGTVQNDCLFIIIFLSNRHSSLFSDLLLLDILSYSNRYKLKKVFLGGSETKSLYDFKKKYIKCFDYAYTQRVMDVNIL